MENEKPFKCPKCSLCFATSDHWVVHQRMHANNEKKENHDLLVKIPATSSDHVSDQTPTPTRFMKIADVESSVLFEEINPFDQDFKLASKRHTSHDQMQSHTTSPISSTSTAYEVCPSQGITMKSFHKIRATPNKLAKTNSDSETEVSSTVTVEGGSSKIAHLVPSIKLREELKKCSFVNHNEISSSTSEEQSDHSTSSLNLNMNKCCKVAQKPEIIKVPIFSNSKQAASCSSTLPCSSTGEEVAVRSTLPLILPNNVSTVITTSPTTSLTTSSSNVTASSSSKNHTIVSSTNDHKQNSKTSLQSILQQIRGEGGDAAVRPLTNAGAQSQEALREQLKSLIKSGQIKIKFTSDPSSPKVQATIVGNIAKKTAVTSRPTMVQDIVTPRPALAQTISTPRPTMVQEIQPKVNEREEFTQKENLSHNSPILPKLHLPQKPTIINIKDSGQLPEKQGSTSQLPHSFQTKVPSTIQIIAKHPISRPILIAPKKAVVTSSDSSSSISISQKTVLPVSDVLTVSTSLSSQGQSASSLVFAKQKLKHTIQQNASNKTDALVNGRISMVATGGLQKKYKDIVLDMKLLESTSTTGGGSTTMTTATTTMASTTTTTTFLNDEHNNKRKHEECEEEDDDEEGNTDEKRKRFLERNRAAASRCRQKRKIWVNQLESKSDNLVQTNTLLMNEINALRSEVVQLKSLLLAHKDCPVTQQQKALLGQMTPGSYIAAVSDGQIIAIHQIPEGNVQEIKSAEEVASSALTDMAARATMELESNVTTTSPTTTPLPTTSSITVQSNIAISTVCNSLAS